MSPTRRALLSSVASLAVALAGCGGRGEADVTPTDHPRRTPSSGSLSDPDVVMARNPDLEASVLLDPTGGDAGSDAGGDGDSAASPIGRELVTDPDRAAALTVADGVPESDAAALRSFVEGTDFSAETLFAAPSRIPSCYRIRIRSVSWEPQRAEYEYCRELRPPAAAGGRRRPPARRANTTRCWC
ncbi:hypothetical protein [Haloparvum sedimenti]|uniref:hypothetical protein n=1 Tax=Haloparvum sedimenti TaxID=1678448 RepID=UPI00071E9D73|nr:hypothetical protein [Haloparvum sedimenti]